jgi:hypothetical protein
MDENDLSPISLIKMRSSRYMTIAEKIIVRSAGQGAVIQEIFILQLFLVIIEQLTIYNR